MATRRVLITLGLAAAAGLGVYRWLRRFPPPPAHRVLITADGPCAPGARLLLSDLIELQNRWIPLPAGSGGSAAIQLQIHLQREGDRLTLQAERDGHGLPPQTGTPAEAIAGLARALDLDPPGAALVPDGAAGWELLDLAGRSQDETSEALVARAGALVQAEPRCAPARLAYGTFLTRFLVEHISRDTLDAQAACESNFREGLSALPGYPRLAALYAIHLTDIGRSREALDLMADGLWRHPGNLGLLNALAYAARASGLLDLAGRALDRRAALAGEPRSQQALADNTLLYQGRTRAFEAELTALPEGPLKAYYQGYARLLQGDTAGALLRFQGADHPGLGSSLFVRLSQVYALACAGRREEALAALDALEGERSQIHLPDGEFTLKLAEAYGYLGEPSKALDVAQRASVQGFGCAEWFERAPFLSEARRLPRWRSLDQHLREREALMSAAFPPRAFGL